MLGLDQHEAGSLAVARILRDAGIEVVYPGRFQTPATIYEIALQEDVDVAGVSAHSWEVVHYAAELATLLHDLDPPVPVLVGGSVITDADREEILAAGIDAVLGPEVGEGEIVAAFRRLAEGRTRV